MINDFMAYGLYHAIFRSCYTPEGQETIIKKMCDDFTERNKKGEQAQQPEPAQEGLT